MLTRRLNAAVARRGNAARSTSTVTVIAMTNTLAGGIYVVASSKGNMTVYWAAATQQADAVATVQRRLPPGWTAILTDQQLTPDQVAFLKLRPGGVRQLRFGAMFGGK
jgi:flagella basal body P-ring formation protein FlgA